jgi:hypothetical protein
MIRLIIIFLVIALVAALFGFGGMLPEPLVLQKLSSLYF